MPEVKVKFSDFPPDIQDQARTLRDLHGPNAARLFLMQEAGRIRAAGASKEAEKNNEGMLNLLLDKAGLTPEKFNRMLSGDMSVPAEIGLKAGLNSPPAAQKGAVVGLGGTLGAMGAGALVPEAGLLAGTAVRALGAGLGAGATQEVMEPQKPGEALKAGAVAAATEGAAVPVGITLSKIKEATPRLLRFFGVPEKITELFQSRDLGRFGEKVEVGPLKGHKEAATSLENEDVSAVIKAITEPADVLGKGLGNFKNRIIEDPVLGAKKIFSPSSLSKPFEEGSRGVSIDSIEPLKKILTDRAAKYGDNWTFEQVLETKDAIRNLIDKAPGEAGRIGEKAAGLAIDMQNRLTDAVRNSFPGYQNLSDKVAEAASLRTQAGKIFGVPDIAVSDADKLQVRKAVESKLKSWRGGNFTQSDDDLLQKLDTLRRDVSQPEIRTQIIEDLLPAQFKGLLPTRLTLTQAGTVGAGMGLGGKMGNFLLGLTTLGSPAMRRAYVGGVNAISEIPRIVPQASGQTLREAFEENK